MNILPKLKSSQGFTLIELLIVMMIIGVLATLTTFNFNDARLRARDVQRRSDLRQYDSALKEYAARNEGFFPKRSATQPASTILCGDLGMANCPIDPRDGATYRYYYLTNGLCAGGTACATTYVLWGKLEETSTLYYIVCSNGHIGENSTAPATYTCPI